MGKHGNKTERLHLRITPQLKADLQEQATEWGMNLSAYITWRLNDNSVSRNNNVKDNKA